MATPPLKLILSTFLPPFPACILSEPGSDPGPTSVLHLGHGFAPPPFLLFYPTFQLSRLGRRRRSGSIICGYVCFLTKCPSITDLCWLSVSRAVTRKTWTHRGGVFFLAFTTTLEEELLAPLISINPPNLASAAVTGGGHRL